MSDVVSINAKIRKNGPFVTVSAIREDGAPYISLVASDGVGNYCDLLLHPSFAASLAHDVSRMVARLRVQGGQR